MDWFQISNDGAAVPDGYAAVPVTAEQQRSPLRICLLVRREADPAGGQLVVLRDVNTARIYLGCVCDVAGAVKQWVELWVQEPAGEESGGAVAWMSPDSNAEVDRRWAALVAQDGEHSATSIHSGWERTAPAAIYADPQAREPFHPRGPSGVPLVLCRDDALLTHHHLPAYSSSAHRYLYEPGGHGRAVLVPVTTGAPTNQHTRPMADFFPAGRSLVVVNPTASPMRVVNFSPLSLDDLLEVLGGSAWAGVAHGRTRLQIGVPADGVRDSATGEAMGGWLLGRGTGGGHLCEAFHLKLRLLAEMMRQVRTQLAATGEPMLNLGPESFRIEMPVGPAAGLPLLWTVRPVLAATGGARAIKVPGLDRPWFVVDGAAAESVYQPLAVRRRRKGRATLKVRGAGGDGPAIEMSMSTADHLEFSPGDLLWLELPLAQRVKLFAWLEPRAADSDAVRLVTLPLDKKVAAALQAADGATIAQVNYELLPALHTPCDLYSLGVLGLRILLHAPGEDFAETLQDLIALARQTGGRDLGQPLQKRIAAALSDDEALAERLGPHRLVRGGATTGAGLPAQLWHETLAILVGMLSGVGPDSTCPDVAEVNPQQPAAVLDAAIADASSLVVRSRSLLLVDWQFNRQVHAAVQKLRRRLESGVSGSHAAALKLRGNEAG